MLSGIYIMKTLHFLTKMCETTVTAMQNLKFRFYIATLTFVSCLLLLLMSSLTIYLTLRERLLNETQDRLRSTVLLGANTLDTKACAELLAQLTANGDDSPTVRSIEQSSAYQTLSRQLNFIRETNTGLIIYTYILTPGTDSSTARFLVDADVLKLRKQAEQDGKTDEEISWFGRYYDLKLQPTTQQALSSQMVTTEKKFVYDELYQVYSMMGFAPIRDPQTGNFMGILGADISDESFQNFISGVFTLTLLVSCGMLFFVLMVAFFISSRLGMPLAVFSEAIRQANALSEIQFIKVDSNIHEVMQLVTHFNTMIDRTRGEHSAITEELKHAGRFAPLDALALVAPHNPLKARAGDALYQNLILARIDLRSVTNNRTMGDNHQTTAFVNSLLSRVGPLVRNHGGLIDHYYASGILAVFPGQVRAATRAMTIVAQSMHAFNRERLGKGQETISAGIGLHVALSSLGIVGEDNHLQTAVISDQVMQTHALAESACEFGVSIVASEKLVQALEDPDEFMMRQLGNIPGQNSEDRLKTYEIYDADDANSRQKKAETKTDFEKAVAVYWSTVPAPATSLFKQILVRNPQDVATLRYLHLCTGRAGQN